MPSRRETWVELFRGLGQALIAEWRAELDVLVEHWKQWGGRAAVTAGLAAVAAVLLIVYLPGLLIFALVAGLESAGGLPLWGAALVVAGAVVLVAALLAGVGWLLLRKHQHPVAAAKSRYQDHLEWWRSRMLEGGDRHLGEGATDDQEDSAD